MVSNIFKVDSTLNEPLYMQLYHRFRDAIDSGQLLAEQRVPSIRALASELNLARGTVELTYQLLISEGILIGRGAKGTFIAPMANCLRNKKSIITPNFNQDTHNSQVTSFYHENEVLPFQLGIPALDAFPLTLWNRLMHRVLRNTESVQLGYPDPQGFIGLREALASYLAVSRGVVCSPEQIFISSGYRASLLLILRSLFQEGDVGWFEEPGYHIAREFLQKMGMVLVPIDVDVEGIDVHLGNKTAEKAKFALVTPTHQSPTNVTLSLERRMDLLKWANEHKSWVIEDDYDSEFRYLGRPIPALKNLDNDNRVIYCGTLSKALFPSLRLSYMVVPTHQVARFKSTAQQLGGNSPIWTQQVSQLFIQEGHFSRHLRKMRNLYRQRRQYLIDAINQVFADILFVHQQSGGMHIVAELINGQSSERFVKQANRQGIGIQSLTSWMQSNHSTQIILLGFTNIKSAQDAFELCLKLKNCYFLTQ
ncbi:PLP-dependent aminotransferase family protein [Providencia stuartii]|nr:PLP-dependent aminotransferase family protein [Providencia stuartii]